MDKLGTFSFKALPYVQYVASVREDGKIDLCFAGWFHLVYPVEQFNGALAIGLLRRDDLWN